MKTSKKDEPIIRLLFESILNREGGNTERLFNDMEKYRLKFMSSDYAQIYKHLSDETGLKKQYMEHFKAILNSGKGGFHRNVFI